MIRESKNFVGDFSKIFFIFIFHHDTDFQKIRRGFILYIKLRETHETQKLNKRFIFSLDVKQFCVLR